MVAAGYINESDRNPLAAAARAPRRKPSSGETVHYFTDYVIGQIDDLVGVSEKDLIVETTLNPAIQASAETAITKALLAAGPDNAGQAAAVVLRLDGAVVAL